MSYYAISDLAFLNNDNYIPQGGHGGLGKNGGIYVDTTPITTDLPISAVSFRQEGNRLVMSVGYYDEIGKLQWKYNTENNSDYWHISKDETYASLASVLVPHDHNCHGIRFIQSGNQLAYQIFTVKKGLPIVNGGWLSPENHDDYWPGTVENTYADTNAITLSDKEYPRGFKVWAKGNRIAPAFIME